MPLVIAAIVIVWSVLFGVAYACRISGALGWPSSFAIVTGSYVILAALALGWFGLTWTGLLSITGMLFPYAVAILVITIR